MIENKMELLEIKDELKKNTENVEPGSILKLDELQQQLEKQINDIKLKKIEFEKERNEKDQIEILKKKYEEKFVKSPRYFMRQICKSLQIQTNCEKNELIPRSIEFCKKLKTLSELEKIGELIEKIEKDIENSRLSKKLKGEKNAQEVSDRERVEKELQRVERELSEKTELERVQRELSEKTESERVQRELQRVEMELSEKNERERLDRRVQESEVGVKNKKNEKNKKKDKIPKSVRDQVWNNYIGSHINEHKCLCCKKSLIKITQFHCGHVLSEKDGGTHEIGNLRPICSPCNHAMGTLNMIDYVKRYGYYVG